MDLTHHLMPRWSITLKETSIQEEWMPKSMDLIMESDLILVSFQMALIHHLMLKLSINPKATLIQEEWMLKIIVRKILPQEEWINMSMDSHLELLTNMRTKKDHQWLQLQMDLTHHLMP